MSSSKMFDNWPTNSYSWWPSQVLPTCHYQMSIDDQEQKKLERKRARNRAAASKCRQKKMDKIAELETQVSSEKQRGHNLDVEIQQLRETLAQLEHLMESQRLRLPNL